MCPRRSTTISTCRRRSTRSVFRLPATKSLHVVLSVSMSVLTVCRDRPVPVRQRLPFDSSVREELPKRVFATACAQSRCRCFDLVIDPTVRTADLVELEVQRDSCFVIWNEDGAQVA